MLVFGIGLTVGGFYLMFGVPFAVLVSGIALLIFAIFAIDIDKPIEKDDSNDG